MEGQDRLADIHRICTRSTIILGARFQVKTEMLLRKVSAFHKHYPTPNLSARAKANNLLSVRVNRGSLNVSGA